MAITTATLLSSIKKIAAVPTSQNTFTDAEILDIASDCIDTEILPKLLMARQEFYVVSEIVTLVKRSGDVYSNCRIPYRAVGQTIVGVYDASNDDTIDPTSYWIENNKILFEEGCASTYRIRYYLKPNRLVETTEAARILSIDTTTGVVTVSSVPATMSAAVLCDFIRAKPGFDTLGQDEAIVSVSSTVAPYTITFAAADLPAELAVGDYISLSEESPIPQVPPEWASFMAYWVAHNMLESLGDVEAADEIKKRLKRLEDNALSLIQPRAESRPRAIMKPVSHRYRW